MDGSQKKNKKAVIIGAGPAGLAAGYELSKHGVETVILEKSDSVGGLARTIEHEGYLFDVGPHRFYTKSKIVGDLWQNLLGPDFLIVPRLTRIFYRKKFFSYPVKPFQVLLNLGPVTSALVMISYIKSKISLRNLKPKTFEEWITKNFGSRLFEMFFKTYTEKVWGIPCDQIGAEWASQRIKNLSFWSTLWNAFGSIKGKDVKSLIEEFNYPKYGAGMMYEKMAEEIKKNGGQILFGEDVSSIEYKDNQIISVTSRGAIGGNKKWQAGYFFSSMPMTELVKKMSPIPLPEIGKAANSLYFRSHIAVNLIVKKANPFPDNWIYIHEPDIKMARLSNFKNFSKHMSKDDNTPVCCEYFVFKDDEMWRKSDEELKILASNELEKLGFLEEGDVVGGFVVREEFAYPTYYIGHKKPFEMIKNFFRKFKNITLIGRGGTYRYNNQDHSLEMGILAARSIIESKEYDLDKIGDEQEYYEEHKG